MQNDAAAAPDPDHRARRGRFDSLALRPPAAAADEAARLQQPPALAQALCTWCQGPGPVLAVATLRSPAATPQRPTGPAPAGHAALAAWADALARRLDGGTRLDSLGRAAGLAWRARILLGDTWPALLRRPDDPWDAGWARTDPPALAHWHAGWRPRRPTLVLARTADAEALAPALAALGRRLDPRGLRVRWLWVGDDGPTPAHGHGETFTGPTEPLSAAAARATAPSPGHPARA